MVCKFSGIKYGSFTDKKTGELVSFAKVVVCEDKPIDENKNGIRTVGQFPTEYRGKFLRKSPDDYLPFVGMLVDLKFDCVLGYKDPELVDILALPSEVRK